ncbi:hypothetical protein HYU95_05200 [Candidatus Daviesbacteria bacterium]|nr:hypothetical protein [Candidatus Daviesbacteria bacterium]
MGNEAAVLEHVGAEKREAVRPLEKVEAPFKLEPPQIRGFDRHKTPLEFRQKLGMSEETSISSQADFQRKEKQLRDYVIGQTANIARDQFHSGKVTLDYKNEEIQRQLADQRLPTRLWREYMKKRLSWAGVKQSGELLQVIEANILIYKRRDFKPEVLSRLVKSLDQNESEAIKKFKLAIQRGHQLYIVPRSYEFRDYPDELAEMIAVLGNMQEETFKKIYHQFDGRTQVLYGNDSFCSGIGKSEQNGLLQIMKQGGLTLNQQEAFNKAVIWQMFAEVLPFRKERPKGSYDHGGNYEYWLEYNDLLNPAIGQQLEKYYPYLVDWAATNVLPERKAQAAGKSPLYGEKLACGGRDFTTGIRYLDSSGKLPQLNALINAGWDCRGIYKAFEGMGYHFEDITKLYGEIEKTFSQILSFQADPERVAWAKAFEEYYYGTKILHAAAVPFYEELYKNKETLADIAIILNSLPKTEGFKPGDFLIWENGEVGLSKGKIINYVQDLRSKVNRGEIPAVPLQFATGFVLNLIDHLEPAKHASSILPDRLQFYSYLATHRDEIADEMFDDVGGLAPNAMMLNKLISEGVPVGDWLMQEFVSKCHNQDKLDPYLKLTYFHQLKQDIRVAALVNLPGEFLATLSKEDQSKLAFFRTLPENLQQQMAALGLFEIASFINNGRPTVAFFENALHIGFFSQARSLFTNEVIAAFTPEQQQFCKACLSLPLEVTGLMRHKNIAEYKNYFAEGVPTSDLLLMVAKNGNQGEIDKLLSVTDLNGYSADERLVWEFFKSIPSSSAIRKNLLDCILSSPLSLDNFNKLRFVVDGKPTEVFLGYATRQNESSLPMIREVLALIDMDKLPVQERAFWEFFLKVDRERTYAIRDALLVDKNRFAEFIENDRPTLAFLNEAAMLGNNSKDNANKQVLIGQILAQIDWVEIPAADQTFWRYYSQNSQNASVAEFLLRNRDQFIEMVVDNQETPLFYQKLMQEVPYAMLDLPKRRPDLTPRQYQNFWRMGLGKEVFDRFLAVLPKSTDEARNAFSGNDFDRTSKFITYLKSYLPKDQFRLDPLEFAIATDYIHNFGLARNETIYRYYRWLYLFEHQKIADLPEEMKNLRLTSTAEMVQRLSEIKKMVFGEEQLTSPEQLRNLTPFQIQMLANVTGFDTARFGSGTTESLTSKISEFAVGLERGTIPSLPRGYGTETVTASSVMIEFNAEAVQGDYNVLRREILECIDQPHSVDQLKTSVKAVIDRRADIIRKALGRMNNEKAVAAMSRQMTDLHSYLEHLDKVSDLDSLTLALLNMNFSNEDRSGGEGFAGIDSVMRRIILSKLYQRDNRSPEFLENVRIKLSQEGVTAEGINEIVLTVDEMIKNHVLSLDQSGQEKYWRPEIVETIIKNDGLRKNFRRITERFNPHAEKLRQEQARFIKTQTGQVAEVKIIPDRGLVGEMAGYLADVCYTRVPNLLQTYSGSESRHPLVIPYKFITGLESGDSRFVGSVLIFEVQTAKGEEALLVRALDIPKEGEIDISKFTESLLDKFADVAEIRGKKKVLVAGTAGTISNYSSITSYVINNYVHDKEPEPVSPDFDFNGYNITNKIYTARIIH